MIRLAVIGAGRHAVKNVYPSLHRLEGAQIVANCDLKLELAEDRARRFGIPRSFTDYREMLTATNPDGVIICIGAEAHAELSRDLMTRGVHVYVEKPTAPGLRAGLEMLRVHEETGRICMTGYKKRFAPAYVKAKELIDSAAFGERTVLSLRRSDGDPTNPNEPATRERLLAWICHTMDLGTFLWGPVHAVRTDKVTVGGKFALSVTMHHAGDALSHQLLTYYPSARTETLLMHGTSGMVVETSNSTVLEATLHGRPVEVHRPDYTTGNSFSDIEQGFAGELAEFTNAVRESREPRENGIRSACHSLAVFEAMWASFGSGRAEDVEFVA